MFLCDNLFPFSIPRVRRNEYLPIPTALGWIHSRIRNGPMSPISSSGRPPCKWLHDNLTISASERNGLSVVVSGRNDCRVVGFPFCIKLMLVDRGGFSRWCDRDRGMGDILPDQDFCLGNGFFLYFLYGHNNRFCIYSVDRFCIPCLDTQTHYIMR